MSVKQEFLDIYKATVARPGADGLLEWLLSTDFFIAPASTRYHCACDAGLVTHSLNVYRLLQKHAAEFGGYTEETAAVCGLLHDICKANFYSIGLRNVKNEHGQWEQKPYYTIEDQFPMGHGEKSVYLINKYMTLSDEEAVAIRWHMGGFDESAKAGGYTISHAYEQYPLAVLLHISDLEATYLSEKGTSEVRI